MKTHFLFTITLGLLFSWQSTTLFPDSTSTIISSEDPGIGVGDKAPHFNLKNVDGKMYALDNLTDAQGEKPKGYIIVFTCNTCPFAKANEDRLIDLHHRYAPKGYPVVAIQPNNPAHKPGDSFDAMKQNANDKGFPFLYLFDEGQKVYPAYGATKTPEVFLLDADFVLRYHGAIDDNPMHGDQVNEKYLENAIAAVEAGQEPETQTTKSIGCAIQ